MHYDTPLITTIVAGLVLAFIFGAVAHRLRMPPLVGYLIAGIAVGPYTPGLIADSSLASQLSEIGVILLMFGVGLHFSLKDLMSVQAVAIPGALLRIAGGTAMGIGLALLMGWTVGAGLVFGIALSVASTVVLLKALQERHLVDSDRGRIAVGWVIVEDIAMVLALVLIPAFAPLLGGTQAEVYDPFIALIERFSGLDLGLPGVLGVTLPKLVAFVGFMLIVGRRLIPYVLHFTAHTGSRELFRLAVLAIALGVAAGAAYLFGVSLALGAFFAGMILSESELSHRAAQESLPLRDAFAVLFFVSVGMLFDPTVLLNSPWQVLGTLFIILFGKSIIGFFLVLLLRRPASAALTISASLAQIGEFSFILAALGVGLGIMPAEGQSLVLAGAILSIILNPAMFWLADILRPHAERRFGRHAEPEEAEPGEAVVEAAEEEEKPHPTALTAHTVLVGFGRVGRIIGEALKAEGTPFLVVEDADGRIAAARTAGMEVVVGNAASPETLALANVKGASRLLVAIPNAFEAGQAIEQSRRLNPALSIISRAHSDEEENHLKHLGANEVIMGEREIGLGMMSLWHGAKASADLHPEPAVAPRDDGVRHEPTLSPAAPPVFEDDPAAPLEGPLTAPTLEDEDTLGETIDALVAPPISGPALRDAPPPAGPPPVVPLSVAPIHTPPTLRLVETARPAPPVVVPEPPIMPVLPATPFIRPAEMMYAGPVEAELAALPLEQSAEPGPLPISETSTPEPEAAEAWPIEPDAPPPPVNEGEVLPHEDPGIPEAAEAWPPEPVNAADANPDLRIEDPVAAPPPAMDDPAVDDVETVAAIRLAPLIAEDLQPLGEQSSSPPAQWETPSAIVPVPPGLTPSVLPTEQTADDESGDDLVADSFGPVPPASPLEGLYEPDLGVPPPAPPAFPPAEPEPERPPLVPPVVPESRR